MASDQSANQSSLRPPGARPLSPSERKRLQQCFERGKGLANQDDPDHDYAHSMFAECVINDPSNLEYLEALFDNLQQKYDNNKRGARLRGFTNRGPFKKAIAASNWSEVFRLGLELLKTNPWDVPTLRALADACKANRYNEVELRYLKNALDFNPKDIEVNKHCAESLARMGQFDQAIACWHRIETIDKKNTEARKKITALTLAKTTGLPPGVDSTDSLKSMPSKSQVAAATAAARSATEPVAPSPPPGDAEDEIKSLERAIASPDASIESFLRLAEHYQSANRHRESLAILKKAMDMTGGANLKVREAYEDAQVNHLRAQVAIADQRAASEKTTEAGELARRFRSELNRQELQVLASRVERYPENKTLKFELAERLKREGNFREALKYFEEARTVHGLRAAATLEMGECCQHLKQYGNAMKCYQSALGDPLADAPHRKLAFYRAGTLAAALKTFELAEKYLDELFQLDPEYRDVRSRLDKVRQIRNSV
jgi:tetratricopeptide (TPR) repeat protein